MGQLAGDGALVPTPTDVLRPPASEALLVRMADAWAEAPREATPSN